MPINISANLQQWIDDHVNEAAQILGRELTTREKEIVVENRMRSRINKYQLNRRIKRKLLNGTYPLPDGVTVESVFLKADSVAAELYDRYIQIEADLCQASDKKLFPDLNL